MPVQPIDASLYTGLLGEDGHDAKGYEDGARYSVVTTRQMEAGEGLTISLSVPRGTIDEPSKEQEFSWWLNDIRNLLISVAGLLLVWGWYGWSWVKVGRDPPRGVVVPRWDAPDDISPALVNYIDNKGFADGGWKAFSAAAVNLAVKGHVTLDDLESSIVLTASKDEPKMNLPAGERSLMSGVHNARGSFTIDKANGKQVKAAGRRFVSAIEAEHRAKYYKANSSYVVGGVVLSAIAFATLMIFGHLSEDAIAMMILPSFAAVFIGIFAAAAGRGLKGRSLAGKVFSIIVLGIVGTIIMSTFGSVLTTVGNSLLGDAEFPTILAMGGIVVANVIFFFIMGAPTPLGSEMMAGIDGLRQYLTLAEKGRMNMADAPVMSPRHFETLLPYAVALGVEEPWTNTFEQWLIHAKGAESYRPGWYHGPRGRVLTRSLSGFSSSMASTIKSTLPAPPKSSSGIGGGGFSGGGGGGGGGGGW